MSDEQTLTAMIAAALMVGSRWNSDEALELAAKVVRKSKEAWPPEKDYSQS